VESRAASALHLSLEWQIDKPRPQDASDRDIRLWRKLAARSTRDAQFPRKAQAKVLIAAAVVMGASTANLYWSVAGISNRERAAAPPERNKPSQWQCRNARSFGCSEKT